MSGGKSDFLCLKKVIFGLSCFSSTRRKGVVFDFSLRFVEMVLVSLEKPLSLLMGKKSAKSHKEKMPAWLEQYFSGIGGLFG